MDMSKADFFALGCWTWAINAVALYIIFLVCGAEFGILTAMGASFVLLVILAPAGIISVEIVIIQAIINALRKPSKDESSAAL